ncbi:S8 family serine peptidase [Kiloniella spongiae]|uniref:S8 family serine peptidase n=1 Tax=Kiloniella spongiae TaxID=1489064 RepID=UPI0006997E49|nr:S8 family serine peptidase [Kiloniella spongiae]
MLRHSLTFLGFLLLSVGLPKYLPAQTSVDPAGTLPGTAPTPAGARATGTPNPDDRSPEILQPDEIIFTGLRANCVRPGTILTIQGKNLDQIPKNNRLGLNNAGKLIELEILNKTQTRISSYLPKNIIEFNTAYDLVFYQQNKEHTFDKTGLSVRICPSNKVASRDSSAEQDVIILVENTQENPVRSELQKRGLPVVDVYNLDALQSVLIQTRTANAAIVIQELRAVFPDAEIDFNNDLTSSAKPRLYAQKAIGWGHDSGCQNTQLGFPIGLLDGAIDQHHIAFVGQSIVSRSFLGTQTIDLSHATSIGSILIGNDPVQGYQGLIPGTTLYNAVVLRLSHSGDQLASTVAVLQGLDWLLSNQVRLINVSLSTATSNRVLNKGFVLSLEKGAIVFSSAGNQGPEAPESYPAALDGVFSVTAIDSRQKIYRDANQGDFIDFAAPGVDIWAATPDNKGAYVSGTSFATPHALAVAALILKNNPKISREVLSRALSFSLIDLGTPGPDPVYGAGLLKGTC